MLRTLIRFFDKFEDFIRINLSRTPILYALVGAVGVILVWKGVWETAELIPGLFGPASIIIGILILLVTGLLVSFFIGDSIMLSGLRREKKLAEKTEAEVESEKQVIESIAKKLDHLDKDVHKLRELSETK
jgi:hypothetical protein